MFVHLTLVPYIGHAGRAEDEADPALGQPSCAGSGSSRDAAPAAPSGGSTEEIREKIALFASLPVDAVISAYDVDNIYKVPLGYRAEGVDDLVLDHFGLEAPAPDLDASGSDACGAPTRRPSAGADRPRRQVRGSSRTPTSR